MAADFNWAEPSLWPKAASSYVFLANAFNEVGKALFPEWTGREALPVPTPATNELNRPPIQITKAPEPPRHSVGQGGRLHHGGGGGLMRLPSLSPSELQAHRDREEAQQQQLRRDAEIERAEVEAVNARRLGAASWIAQRCRDGELESYGWWALGGVEPVKQEPSLWNRRNDWELFEQCASLKGVNDRPMLFLFLARECLDRCLADIRRPGIKPHPSSLAAEDQPLLEEMRQLIEAGEVTGPNPAALHVVGRAAGGGTLESKVRRLEKRYLQKFGA